MTRGMGTALGLALTGSIFTVAGGDAGSMERAAHAFSVTAFVLALDRCRGRRGIRSSFEHHPGPGELGLGGITLLLLPHNKREPTPTHIVARGPTVLHTMATSVVDSIPDTLQALLTEFERAPLELASVARMSGKDLGDNLDAWHRLRSIADGAIVQLQGEANRRELFREDGAPSSGDWQVARFGLSASTAKTYDQVADKAMDLPVLTRALGTGEISA